MKSLAHYLHSLAHGSLSRLVSPQTDRQLLDAFSAQLDQIERRVPMTGSYARVDPHIIDCRQAGIDFRFLIYHVESQLWFGRQIADGFLMQAAECSLISPGQTVFDIGCNSGFLTTWFAKQVGPAGRVLAFDPFPWNTLATEFTARLNGCQNVRCLTLGIGDRHRSIRVPFCDAKSYENSAFAATETFPINIVPLDDYAAKRPHFIKVDIEGAERDLLAGAVNILRQSPRPTWFIEVHNEFIRTAGADPDQLARDFLSHGYECRIGHPHGTPFETLTTLPEGCALYAVPATRGTDL